MIKTFVDYILFNTINWFVFYDVDFNISCGMFIFDYKNS